MFAMPFYPQLSCERHQHGEKKEAKFTAGWVRGFFVTFVFVARAWDWFSWWFFCLFVSAQTEETF